MLLAGLVLDKIYRLLPQHIFDVKNFTEKTVKQGYILLPNAKGEFLLVKDRSRNVSFMLRKNTSDFKVFDQIWIEEEFREVMSLIAQNDIEINTIIDAGANIGLVSLYLKNTFSEAKIICVEPDSFNLKQLKKNVSINHLSNIHFLKGGLWPHDGFMEMDYNFRDGLEWLRKLTSSKKGTGNIPVFTLSTILKKYNLDGVDLLKIDIEGAEEEVFKEGADYEFLRKTKIVTLEIHDLEKMGHKIINILQVYDFRIHMSGELIIGINKRAL